MNLNAKVYICSISTTPGCFLIMSKRMGRNANHKPTSNDNHKYYTCVKNIMF